MAAWRPHGRASVNPRNPSAFGICSRCGFQYNLRDLRRQKQWAGSRLVDLNLLVCSRCLDVPASFLRTLVLPPDPPPLLNARPENYALYFKSDVVITDFRLAASSQMSGRATIAHLLSPSLAASAAATTLPYRRTDFAPFYFASPSLSSGLTFSPLLAPALTASAAATVLIYHGQLLAPSISATAGFAAQRTGDIRTTADFATTGALAATPAQILQMSASLAASGALSSSIDTNFAPFYSAASSLTSGLSFSALLAPALTASAATTCAPSFSAVLDALLATSSALSASSLLGARLNASLSASASVSASSTRGARLNAALSTSASVSASSLRGALLNAHLDTSASVSASSLRGALLNASLATSAGASAELELSEASIAQVDSATSSGATIVIPTSVVAGDLLVLWDSAVAGAGTPSTVVPSGFTSIINTPIGARRAIASYRLATGGEAGASRTGMNGDVTNRKCLYVFRRSPAAATSLTVSTPNGQATEANPNAQTVSASGGVTPLVVLGCYTATHAIAPRTFTVGGSAAKDGEINASAYHYLAYKIYDSSPSDVVVDMDDEGPDGTNVLCSFYIEMA